MFCVYFFCTPHETGQLSVLALVEDIIWEASSANLQGLIAFPLLVDIEFDDKILNTNCKYTVWKISFHEAFNFDRRVCL